MEQEGEEESFDVILVVWVSPEEREGEGKREREREREREGGSGEGREGGSWTRVSPATCRHSHHHIQAREKC